VIVSLGHSAAKLDTVLAAIDAGATGFTHLFNAMSGLTAREPGMIAAALFDKRVSSGLIVDLHHVAPYNCELAYQCIGASRLMLVTDAMAHVGSNLKTLAWLNSQIVRHGDKLTLEDGSIAGSCLDMASAVRNMCGILSGKMALKNALQASLNMASKAPSNFLELKNKGELKVGNQANFVVLGKHQKMKETWINGVFID
jgi:N-acetylglucosamine-6-phosphate deacetylase